MASTTWNSYHRGRRAKHTTSPIEIEEENYIMSTEKKDDQYINTPVAEDDDFDFAIIMLC